MKALLAIALILGLISCTNEITQAQKNKQLEDSLEMDQYIHESAAEKMANYMEQLNWDTVGVSKCGLIVTNARFVQEEYSNYKSIRLSYRNNTGKKIKAIRFRWYGLNAFNEPADCGDLSNRGFGGGFEDDYLGVGSATSGTWDVLSNDGDKVVKAWPREIAFSDGTIWKSTYKN